jgi:hypothetical protein
MGPICLATRYALCLEDQSLVSICLATRYALSLEDVSMLSMCLAKRYALCLKDDSIMSIPCKQFNDNVRAEDLVLNHIKLK